MIEVDENGNEGTHNDGCQNYGDQNNGNHNAGDQNFGNHNAGNQNFGNHNFGTRNYGDHNFGNHNIGHYNRTHQAQGCFNTKPTLEYSVFNKPYDAYLGLSDMPLFLRNVELITCRGYLRENDYEAAIRKAWEEATEDERRAVLDLPNWDNEIFEAITGIDVENELQNQSQSNKED